MEEVWVGGVRKWRLVRGVERVQVERGCKYRVKRCEQGNWDMRVGERWVEGRNDGIGGAMGGGRGKGGLRRDGGIQVKYTGIHVCMSNYSITRGLS